MAACHGCGVAADLADLHMWRGVRVTARRRLPDRLLCESCHEMRRSARTVVGQLRLGGIV